MKVGVLKLKKIFVNATSCTVGGSKTILLQFIENIEKSIDNVNYYIFISDKNIVSVNQKNLIFIEVKAKKWTDRLRWDSYGMKLWSKKNKVYPDKIVSLQNTGVNFNKNVLQIIYLHTPIPFVNYNWNITKKEERKLWFYKHIYPFFISLYRNKNTEFVVQSEWLKNSVSNKLGIEKNKINVFFPDFPKNHVSYSEDNDISDKDDNYLFYPAMNYIYKNHEIIILALKKIKESNYPLYQNIKVVFTLNEKTNVAQKAKKEGVFSQIIFTGTLTKKEVDNYYQHSKAVLFPSYIETFGLPLLEAKMYNKQILSSDEEFSHEILYDYKNVEFINKSSSTEWAKHIEKLFLNNSITNDNTAKKEEHINTKSWPEFFSYINNF